VLLREEIKRGLEINLKKQNKTKTDLARAMEISRPVLSRILNGKIRINVNHLTAFSDFLNIKPWQLLRHGETKRGENEQSYQQNYQ
jgi:transcriptional regulator with XRE-family HTH domain